MHPSVVWLLNWAVFLLWASLVYFFEDILSLFRSRGGWVSSKGYLMIKQNRNPSELLLEGFL